MFALPHPCCVLMNFECCLSVVVNGGWVCCGQVRYFDKNIRIFRTATQEDLVIAEGVQASFSSGANSRDGAILGRFEHSLAYFHDAVAAACGRSGPTKP